MPPTVINQEFYNYMVTSFDIIYPDGKISNVLPAMIHSIIKLDDYDNNYFPMLNVKFNVHINDYYKILQNKTKVQFRLRIQKYKSDTNKPNEVTGMKSDLFNEVFISYIDDDTPNFNKELYDKAKEVSGTKNTSSPEDYAKVMDLYLFRQSDMIGTAIILNKVLGGLSLTDMVFDVYKNCKMGSNLLMQRFENTRSFSEIVIPPLPMLGVLRYLETTYGNFYNGASTIFFDYKTRYILKKCVGCFAWRPQEFKQTVFIVQKSSDSKQGQVSCYKDNSDRKYYVNVTPEAVNISKTSITNDAMDASNIILVDSKSGNKENISTGLDKQGAGNSRVVYHEHNNSRLGQEIKSNMTSEGLLINIRCNNIDLDCLAPNKEMVLKFMDKRTGSIDMSGSYRLKSMSNRFEKNGNLGFNLVTTITLSK